MKKFKICFFVISMFLILPMYYQYGHCTTSLGNLSIFPSIGDSLVWDITYSHSSLVTKVDDKFNITLLNVYQSGSDEFNLNISEGYYNSTIESWSLLGYIEIISYNMTTDDLFYNPSFINFPLLLVPNNYNLDDLGNALINSSFLCTKYNVIESSLNYTFGSIGLQNYIILQINSMGIVSHFEIYDYDTSTLLLIAEYKAMNSDEGGFVSLGSTFIIVGLFALVAIMIWTKKKTILRK